MPEAAYKKNTAVHRATKKSPYEIVFGTMPHKEFQPHSNKPNTSDMPKETTVRELEDSELEMHMVKEVPNNQS